MTRPQHMYACAVLAVGLVIGGCSADAARDADAGSASGRDTGRDAEGGRGSAADDASREELSPLAEYLGMSYRMGGAGTVVVGSSEGMTDEDRQRFRRVEEVVAECMRDAGFEYVPRSLDEVESASAAFDEVYSLDPEEFARNYGYGISTLTDLGAGDDRSDPNAEIRDGLSESARQAYDAALWGELANDMSAVEFESTTEVDFESIDMGCHGTASDEVYGGEQRVSLSEPDFGSLFGDIQRLEERIEAEPRIVAAVDEWRQCMAAAGHPGFARIPDARDSVFDRMFELHGGNDDDVAESASAIAIGETDAAAVDLERLAAVRDYEVDVATADHTCQQEHYEPVYRDVAFAMEQEFVDTHRAELERFRDWLAETGGAG